MLKNHLLAMFALILAFSSYASSQTEWTKFVPPDKSCSILMPNDPTKEPHEKDTDQGKVVTTLWISKYTANGYLTIYMLGITDYPVDLVPKTELDLDRDNFLKAVNAKLLNDSDITLKGIPGKEFTGASDTYTFKSRVFYANRRAYQVVAAEPTDHFDPARIKKFLESFTFGN